MIEESKKSILTRDVLKSISYHLSSREDCKDVEYVVSIEPDDSGKDAIIVTPYITVFPDIHNRKESDRRGVAYHVIYNHFSEIFSDSISKIVHVKRDTLVTGRYVYRKYKLTNRRRWVKI